MQGRACHAVYPHRHQHAGAVSRGGSDKLWRTGNGSWHTALAAWRADPDHHPARAHLAIGAQHGTPNSAAWHGSDSRGGSRLAIRRLLGGRNRRGAHRRCLAPCFWSRSAAALAFRRSHHGPRPIPPRRPSRCWPPCGLSSCNGCHRGWAAISPAASEPNGSGYIPTRFSSATPPTASLPGHSPRFSSPSSRPPRSLRQSAPQRKRFRMLQAARHPEPHRRLPLSAQGVGDRLLLFVLLDADWRLHRLRCWRDRQSSARPLNPHRPEGYGGQPAHRVRILGLCRTSRFDRPPRSLLTVLQPAWVVRRNGPGKDQRMPEEQNRLCPDCHGTGVVRPPQDRFPGSKSTPDVPCPTCGGMGRIPAGPLDAAC